jgi:hypothetical protein
MAVLDVVSKASGGLSSSSSKGGILRYPLSIGQSNAPAILFNIHKAQYNNSGTGVNVNSDSHIALYMTQGLNMKDSMQYEDRASGIAGSFIDAKFEMSLDGIKKAVSDITDAAKAGATSSIGKGVLAAGSARLLGIGPTAALVPIIGGALDESTKKTQHVLTENPFITFKGVGLREWSFTWSFIPESEDESRAAKAIIHKFRVAMYPEKNTWTLGFPMVFNIEYINAEFPKMPEVALTSCSVDYNKDSNSFFMQNNEPVRMDMSLTFKELMPIYQKHIKQGY